MSQSITVYGASDMTGETVARIVRAASAQFPDSGVTIKILRHVSSARQIIDFIEGQGDDRGTTAVFHTILNPHVRASLRNALQTMRIPSVDLLGSTAHVMASLLEEEPQLTPNLTIDDGAEPVSFDLAV